MGENSVLRLMPKDRAWNGPPLYVAPDLYWQSQLRPVLHSGVHGHSTICTAGGVRNPVSIVAARPPNERCKCVWLLGEMLLFSMFGDLGPVHVHVLRAGGVPPMAHGIGLRHVRLDAASTSRAAHQARG